MLQGTFFAWFGYLCETFRVTIPPASLSTILTPHRGKPWGSKDLGAPVLHFTEQKLMHQLCTILVCPFLGFIFSLCGLTNRSRISPVKSSTDGQEHGQILIRGWRFRARSRRKEEDEMDSRGVAIASSGAMDWRTA
ncbi:hypothetical protein C8J56DRAFT_1068912 [Mycena floridula]|nr:hypothetical protein C8J56DRAFT_1068912 [Mycena floridula]